MNILIESSGDLLFDVNSNVCNIMFVTSFSVSKLLVVKMSMTDLDI